MSARQYQRRVALALAMTLTNARWHEPAALRDSDTSVSQRFSYGRITCGGT